MKIREFLERMLAAGLITEVQIDALTDAVLEKLVGFLDMGDEAGAIQLMQSLTPQASQDSQATPSQAPMFAQGGAVQEAGQEQYEPGKLYVFTDDVTGRQYQVQFKGYKRVVSGKRYIYDKDGVKVGEEDVYEDVPDWGNAEWIKAPQESKGSTRIQGIRVQDGYKIATAVNDAGEVSESIVGQAEKPESPNDTAVGIREEWGHRIATYRKPDGSTYDVIIGVAESPEEKQRAAEDRQRQAETASWERQKFFITQDQAERERRTQAITNQVNQWIASQGQEPDTQHQRDLAAWQNRTVGLTGPSQWISYWEAQRLPPPQAPIPSGSSGLRGGFGLAESAIEAARKGYSDWMPAGTAQRMTGVDMNRQKIWDDVNQKYRPETDFEYQYRTQTQPARAAASGYAPGVPEEKLDISPTPMTWSGRDPNQAAVNAAQLEAALTPYLEIAQSQVPNWNQLPPSDQNEFLSRIIAGKNQLPMDWNQQQVTNWLQGKAGEVVKLDRSVGPQTPGYLRPVVQSTFIANENTRRGTTPGQYQINLRRLGQAGSAIRAPSAQMWQQWSPSQQSGYRGLVEATGVWDPRTGRRAGSQDWNDYMTNTQRMWQSSRPGQLARKAGRSY